MKKCKITIDKIIFEVVLFNSPTANKIWNSLPISSNIKTWGKEIYFYTDVVANKEPNAKSIIELGEIAYWPTGKAIAIGFGKTPISQKDEIRLADDCNIWGETKFNLKKLENIAEGQPIKIEKI
jgi:hypothetical protein|tara:strand:+ start:186 stop:557 length:372 start_codon:yes stop_codon:yes gene_type:complete